MTLHSPDTDSFSGGQVNLLRAHFESAPVTMQVFDATGDSVRVGVIL